MGSGLLRRDHRRVDDLRGGLVSVQKESQKGSRAV